MKIVFVTAHNWEGYRQGGFHKFAEAAARGGHKVVFLSIPRPFYTVFLHSERLNRKVLSRLVKGMTYELNDGSKLLNCTWPTLDIPNRLMRFIPNKWIEWASLNSLIPFKLFCTKFLKNTDCFVYESVAPYFFPKFKRAFPNAKFIYRPSDPLMYTGASDKVIQQEIDILFNSDKVFIVNQKGIDLYKSHIPDFDQKVNYEILSNGVDVLKYTQKYPCPEYLKKPNTALYMGVWVPDWDAIFYAAKKLPHVNFVIVCPERTPDNKEKKAESLSNVIYIDGIYPNEVPAWVTNANLIIVPYPESLHRIRPLGMTAKYYQAIAAQKAIVVLQDMRQLEDYGINVSYSYDEFADSIAKHISDGKTAYPFDVNSMDWSVKTRYFLDGINKLFND